MRKIERQLSTKLAFNSTFKKTKLASAHNHTSEAGNVVYDDGEGHKVTETRAVNAAFDSLSKADKDAYKMKQSVDNGQPVLEFDEKLMNDLFYERVGKREVCSVK